MPLPTGMVAMVASTPLGSPGVAAARCNSPSSPRKSGTEIAGCPVTLKIAVKGVNRPDLRKDSQGSWLQVSMEQNMGCAVGACLGCVIMGVGGPQRVCREGPVFAAEEIAWEGWR